MNHDQRWKLIRRGLFGVLARTFVVFSLLYLVMVIGFAWSEYQNRKEKLIFVIEHSIGMHESQLKSELYLGQEIAAEQRLYSIAEEVKIRFEGFQVCFQLNSANSNINSLKNCPTLQLTSFSPDIRTKKIDIGDQNFGELLFRPEKPLNFIDFFPFRYVFGFFLVFGASAFVLIRLIRHLKVKVVSVLLKELETESGFKAIGQTMQMLAHDMRRPFAMIKMLLSALSKQKSFESMSQFVEKALPEVERGVTHINSMIHDVMDAGNSHHVVLKNENVSELIHESIHDALLNNMKAVIQFSYELEHSEHIRIDKIKVTRVLTNILSNAFQAMEGEGHVWFKTKQENGRVTIVIGNSGPSIPEDSLKSLFDPYFTKGGHRGTGLGLSIAKQIVDSHNGMISVRNTREGVEFVVSIPSEKDDSTFDDALLIPTSEQYYMAEKQSEKAQSIANESLQALVLLREELRDRFKTLGRKIRVIVCDENEESIRHIRDLVENDEVLKSAILLDECNTAVQLKAFHANHSYDLLILEYSANSNTDGFQIARDIRVDDVEVMVCMCSGFGASELQSEAFLAGADMFISKPIKQDDFFGLILNTVEV